MDTCYFSSVWRLSWRCIWIGGKGKNDPLPCLFSVRALNEPAGDVHNQTIYMEVDNGYKLT